MTTDDPNDPYDPDLAERFGLFDHLTPPPRPGDTIVADNVASIGDARTGGAGPASGRDRRWRTAGVIAAAAAVVVATGLTVAAIGRNGGSSEVEASDGGLTQSEATDDGDPTMDRSNGSVVSTSSTTSTTSTTSEGEGAGSSSSPDQTTVEVSVPEPTSSTSSTLRTTTTSASVVSTTDPVETTVPSTVVETTSTTTSNQGGSGELSTIQGVVTEVFTDCQSRWILNEANEPEQVGPVSCDGGSHITVNGQRIQTSSGYVSADASFDRHPKTLLPGKTVTVTAIRQSNGIVSLNCAQCGVQG